MQYGLQLGRNMVYLEQWIYESHQVACVQSKLLESTQVADGLLICQ